MRFARSPILAVPALALALTLAPARDAAACGGCFHVPTENTQVASHRMVLSVSQAQSTLYDEVQYSGDPSSFAWVLPVKGTITLGLSSDALFAELDQLTAVTVSAPNLPCPSCSNGPTFGGGSGSSSASSSGGTVTVVSQMVVGPYATVQLSSSDPTALATWLTTNGYAVPADIAPTIASYVSEGFDFLALKLVPGMNVTAMRPVRVTTPGAAAVLPLRMVAAGAGVTVPITLFVVGEGRYQPTNFPWFTIDPSQLVWDFSTEMSNYTTLRQQGFTASGGTGWLVESAQPVSEQAVAGPITQVCPIDPIGSGYADGMGNGAPAAAQADLATLFDGITPTSLWITRLLAELPRTALSTDLTLGAATSQTTLPALLSAPKYVNAPPCPCGGSSSSSGGTGGAGTGASGTGASSTGGSGGAGGTGGAGGDGGQSGAGCAVGESGGAPLTLGGLCAALALAVSRRRRTRVEA